MLNKDALLDHGDPSLRGDAIDIIEHAIRAADPYQATLDLVSVDGETLRIGPLEYDLRTRRGIFVLGAGKATRPIAQALEERLGERLTDGVVVLKWGEASRLKRIRTVYAGHPIPDQGSLQGGQELMRLAGQAGQGDLVIAAITGGSSALAVLPPEGITLEDKRRLNELLLASGASIFEINAVRKHVSRLKGGRLALQVFPAELASLTVSDVVGDRLDYITDLTVPDTSTYIDAWNTLEKYRLWERLPASIRAHLRGGPATESPKSFAGKYHTFVVVPGDAALQGATRRSAELGYRVQVFPGKLEGESRAEALALLAEARRAAGQGGPRKPCAMLASGETLVALEDPPENDTPARGGPNQEFALGAALALEGEQGILLASIDVDGNDGPTEAAGAIVDGGTAGRARSVGLDPAGGLRRHASYDILQASRDLVFTGPTGTNVNDLMFVLMDQTYPA